MNANRRNWRDINAGVHDNGWLLRRWEQEAAERAAAAAAAAAAAEEQARRERSQTRCRLLKEDLMAATWHPDRMLTWCLTPVEAADMCAPWTDIE
jgi:hypothetical protein